MQTLHPLVVHFPIALLTLYVGIEFFSVIIKKWKHSITILYIKLLLLITGTIGSFLSLRTGEEAEDIIGKTFLIARHESFAEISTKCFLVLAIFYGVKWLILEGPGYPRIMRLLPVTWQSVIARVVRIVEGLYMPLILALLGFFALSITGALGGAIVHGPDVDPMVRWSVDMFGSGTLQTKKRQSAEDK